MKNYNYYYILIPIIFIFLSLVIYCYYYDSNKIDSTHEESTPLVYCDVEAPEYFTDINPLHLPKKEKKIPSPPKKEAVQSIFNEDNPMHSGKKHILHDYIPPRNVIEEII